MNFTVILGALAVGMLNFGDKPAFYSSFAFTVVAMLCMLYALYTYHWRARSIRRRGQSGFDDRVGPTLLAIILLLRCELRLLQSTIVGVVLLHLLLVPGTSFLTGGTRLLQQHLDPHRVRLNHMLLIIA